MIEPKETLYRTFQHPLSDVDLHTHFTIDASDLAFAQQQVRRKGPLRTQLLILLKCAQYLHYLPSAKDIPYAVMQHITYSVDNNGTVTKKSFTQEYATSRTYSRHAKAIRKHLRWNCDSSQIKQHCLSIGSLIAEKRERLVDIFNALTESLMRHQFELPAFTTLEKIAYNVRARANEQWYHDIGEAVSSSDQKKLLKLLDELEKDEHYSDWHKIKQDPSAPTYKKIGEFIEHLQWLTVYAQLAPQVNTIPLVKRQKFRDEALSQNSYQMRRMKQSKRLALVIVLIRAQYSKALDSACELIIKTMHEIVSKATKDYLQACNINRGNTDDLVELLRDLISVYQNDELDVERGQALCSAFPSNTDDLLVACNEHLALSESNNRPFMMDGYTKRRSLLLDLLGCIEFDSHRQDKSFLSLSEIIIQNRHKRSKTDCISNDQIDLKWLTDKAMRKLVIIKSNPNITEVNRRYLELAWLLKFKDLLKTKDCFVNGACNFSDNQQQLITDEQYDDLIDEYVDSMGLSKEGAEFTKNLKEALTAAADKVDQTFPGLNCASIKDERLVLKRVRAKTKNKKQIERFKAKVKKRIPKTNIVDALTYTIKWLNLHKQFGPLSGLEGKVADPIYRLVATLFCFGCNVGVTATADALKGLSRKQVA